MSDMTPSDKARRVLRVVRKDYPEARCLLDHENALQLLIATILAAQCTDARVNQVTPELFRRFPTAAHFARAKQETIEKMIRSTGFFRNKAKAIRGCCAAIGRKHGGVVPEDLDALVALPGVGRKTANVIRATCFNQQGIIVDTHLSRVTRRLGLTKEKDPVKIEFDLQAIVPEKGWSVFSHGVNFHGRLVCHARKPLCEECHLNAWCDDYLSRQGGTTSG